MNTSNMFTMADYLISFLFYGFIAFLIYNHFRKKKLKRQLIINGYKESAYFKQTGRQFEEARNNKGYWGEYSIYNILRECEDFGSKFLFNIVIPKDECSFSEIDVLMISRFGLVVFESKNYSGWIYGNENQQMWTETFPNGQKERFYNPVWQNNTHIKHLREMLKADIPTWSIIVFSNQCKLKNITYNVNKNKNVFISQLKDIPTIISTLYLDKDEVLTDEEVERVYSTLLSYTINNTEDRIHHILDVTNKYSK